MLVTYLSQEVHQAVPVSLLQELSKQMPMEVRMLSWPSLQKQEVLFGGAIMGAPIMIISEVYL